MKPTRWMALALRLSERDHAVTVIALARRQPPGAEPPAGC
jgi:hypothetical protein